MICSITSLSNQKIKNLYKDTRDTKKQLFVIESLNLIKEHLYESNFFDIILTTQEFLDKNQMLKKHKEIIVVNQIIINKIAFTKSPGECIAIKKLKIMNFEINKNNNYIILDNIQDPGNMATIIRTSVALGINNFFISDKSVSIYNDKFLRSTMGTIFNIKINIYSKLLDIIDKLESLGIECIASCLDKTSCSLDLYKPKSKFQAFILGNESKGINKEVLSKLKNKIYIKINDTDSLNVASAASIILYQKYLWDKNE